MADTLTEFINDPGLTLTELQAGVPIVTNTATEQAVVKDVLITNPNNRGLTLSVDNTVVNSVDTSIKLSGSEIIGASSSLQLKALAQALFNNFTYFNTTSSYQTYALNSTVFTGASYPSISATGVQTNYTTTIGTSHFTVIAANGDFYYSDNASGALYRRAGGPNGTQTNITSRGCGCSYDGRYIYSFEATSTTVLQVTDTQNNGSTVTRTINPALPSAVAGLYANSSAIDGYVWVHPSYDQTCYLINGATGASVQVGGIAESSANKYFVGIGKALNGDYYGLQTQTNFAGLALYWWNFGPDLSTAYVKASGVTASTYNSGTAYDYGPYNALQRVNGISNFIIVLASPTYIFDLDNITSSPFQMTLTASPGLSTNNYGRVLTLNSATANTDFGVVGIRATGVKTTS